MACVRLMTGREVMTPEEFALWWRHTHGLRVQNASFSDSLRQEVARQLNQFHFRRLALVCEGCTLERSSPWRDAETYVAVWRPFVHTSADGMFRAVRRGDVESVLRFLEEPHDPDTVGPNANSAMHVAAPSCGAALMTVGVAFHIGGTWRRAAEQSRLCPELDSFRRQLWGDSAFTMPKALEDLLGVAVSGPSAEALAAISQPIPANLEAEAELGPPDMPDFADEDMGSTGHGGMEASSECGAPSSTQEKPRALPLVDMSASQVLAAPASSKDDVVAFDELFQKFCGGGANQFAYFDECWSKTHKAKSSLADAEGAVVEAKEPKEPKDRSSKRPLFDLTNLEATKPIETEAVAKHQMNEKASQWQLRKDVPPYMIDRITMPSWQTWSKVDFACLGLRPHLMLKLVRKPPPPNEGPHGFSDLFSTVVVENNEAFPWLASEKAARRDDAEDELLGEENFEDDGSGLPAHLEVDPQELFLGPDDKVLPGGDGDELGEDTAGDFMAGLDFELAEKPTSAENVDIGYSRNSKFVDVKLVKKHLWGCLEKDLGKAESKIASRSFQSLVSRTVSAMPKGECENLSAAVCFICALHLCNEKNLELQVDPANPFGDFAVVDVLHWQEDWVGAPILPHQAECIAPWACTGQPLFTQDAPEVMDAEACLGLHGPPKCGTCSLLCSGHAKEVTKWHAHFGDRGTYRHRDATVRVSYSAVVNLCPGLELNSSLTVGLKGIDDALARAVKWLLRKRLWKKKPWAPLAPQVVEEAHMGPERTAAVEVVRLFNQVLGSGAEVEVFWEQNLVPEASRRFGFPPKVLQRHRVTAQALFQAMEHHCRVKFELSAPRPFFSAGYPEPLSEADLASVSSGALQQLFPHLATIKAHWTRRLEHYDAVDETRQVRDHMLQEPSFRGFWPDVRIICARGEEWSAAVSAPTKHTRDGRWDRVFQVLKLQLTLSRALGDSSGGVLQGIAVALLEMAKQAAEKPEKPDELDEMAVAMTSSGPKVDKKCLKKTLWAADLASKMLPSTISAWWAQLAAVEAEWLMGKHVEAHSRVQRLQKAWDRYCPDQPVLMLRLEGTAARLYAQQGDWTAAATHTERCCVLAERAFGRTHPATVALKARLGDAWSRREDWEKATAAYQEAYSVAQVGSDEKTTGRLGFELAQVLFLKGDLNGAKTFAEDAVKLLIPLDLGHSNGKGQLGTTSFDALLLLSQVYEDLCRRLLELHETEQAEVSPPMLQVLITKAIKCFETVLKNLPPAQQARRKGRLSRAAEIVESVLRLKVIGLGDGEYTVLVDSVEELLLHASVSKETASALQRAMSQTRGVRQLQPRAETRAVAEAALRPVSSSDTERPEKLSLLFEQVAREALINSTPPSTWFDQMVRVVAEGFAGAPVPGDPTYVATIQMLELCRYFGDAARVIMCASK
ncbi:unnamed protein product [Effrenium voratum]|nr:unnamed protein product [Effrenium voratum]